MKTRLGIAVLASVLLLSACASAKGFEDADPEAHSACTKFLEDDLMTEAASDDELVLVLGTEMIIGEHAAKASTAEVQATAKELEGVGQWLIDEAALIEVCEDNGYEVSTGSLAEHWQAENS